MSASLYSPFAGLAMEEVVPEAMEVKGVSRASVLQGRRRIKLQPQTGTTAQPNSLIQFVVADSTGLLDCNSMIISYTQKITGGTNACFDEGHVFRRVQVAVNGSLLEDLDLAHKAANAEIYANVGPGFYRTEGSFMNMWKFNPDIDLDANYGVLDVVNKKTQKNRVDASGCQIMWPMGAMVSSMRSKTYWPLRNMGELLITLTPGQPNEVCWGTGAVDYQLSDIYLEFDIVVPLPAYGSLIDSITQSAAESGLAIPVNAKLAVQGAAIASAGQNQIITSIATNNLRRVDFAFQPQSGLVNPAYPSISCFPNPYNVEVQFRSGSLYYPSQPANSLGRQAALTYAAFGEVADIAKSGMFNSVSFSQYTTVGASQTSGLAYAVLPTTGGTLNAGSLTVSAATSAAKRNPYADCYVISYSFDNFKGGEQLAYDGISVLGQSGSQLICSVSPQGLNGVFPAGDAGAGVDSLTPLIVLTRTRFLNLKDAALRIQGV